MEETPRQQAGGDPLRALKLVAPGTPLRESLDSILRARTGALIVIGDGPRTLSLLNGGFALNVDFTPSHLYELAKMDGAIVLSGDARRILHANVQLVPDPSIASAETGIRHRTAERVAKQTGDLVIAISQRRNMITLYRGNEKYVLSDLGVILAKANQAVQTLERYKGALNRALAGFTALEMDNAVTLSDLAAIVQRMEMVLHINEDIVRYVSELGSEGKLVGLQAEELEGDIEEEELHVFMDYCPVSAEAEARSIRRELRRWSTEELLDLPALARALGFPAGHPMETRLEPRGYRILSRIPRLPGGVVSNLVQAFGNIRRVMEASAEELDGVDGIGEVRARSIKEWLYRLHEQTASLRH